MLVFLLNHFWWLTWKGHEDDERCEWFTNPLPPENVISVLLTTKPIKVSDIKYFGNTDIAPTKFWLLPVKYPVSRHKLRHSLLILLLLQLLQSLKIFFNEYFFFFHYFPPDLMYTGTKQPCAASSVGACLRARLGWARDPAWPRSLNTMCTAWPGAWSVVISVIICETESAPGSGGQDVNNPSGCSFVAEHSGVFR